MYGQYAKYRQPTMFSFISLCSHIICFQATDNEILRPIFMRPVGTSLKGSNTACWFWVRGLMDAADFPDKSKIRKKSILLNHHPQPALTSKLVFTLTSLTVLLHIHFWHLLKSRVKSARCRTESNGKEHFSFKISCLQYHNLCFEMPLRKSNSG